MNSFKTKVSLDISLGLSLKGFGNHDVETKTVEIAWDLEMDMRSWGVKDIVVSIPDQQITVLLNIWGDDSDTEQELTLDVKDVLVDRGSSEFFSFAPQALEFYNGKWTLVF